MSIVVFMRGVNVGRAKRFQPSLLASGLEHLGVTNIGAAGTFVVAKRLRQATIRAEFLRGLPFATELMVCHGRDLLKLAAKPAIPAHAASPDVRHFVTILAQRPRALPALPWSYPPGDQWQVMIVAISGRFVSGVWRRLGRSPLEPNAVVEKYLGVRATTRNWNTILRICDLLRKAPSARGL